MKLLVTGVSGLVGNGVARAAVLAGQDVVAVGRRRPVDLPTEIGFYVADLSDEVQAELSVRDVLPDAIIHSAWETRQPSYWEDPDNLKWVLSTTRMAMAFADTGGHRFIQVGSCAEYAFDDPLRDAPATRYGKAKLAAFHAVAAAAQDRYAAVEARIFWAYGPGETATRFIPSICRAHAIGAVPEIGSGSPKRDLLYVDDVAHALLALLVEDAPVGVVDIGAGKGTPLAEVAITLAKLAGTSETGLGRRPDRSNEPTCLVADATKLCGTGWRPKVSLEVGLAKTYDWWCRQVRDER